MSASPSDPLPLKRDASAEPASYVEGEPLRPKRVLFFGKRKSRSKCTGALVDALRTEGLQVVPVNCSLLRRWIGTLGMRATVRLIRRIYRPDLCFVFFHDLPPLLMEQFSGKIPTVVWMEEQTAHTDSSHVDYVRNVRLLCLSTPNLVRAYHSQGVQNATFLMSGFSRRFHRPFPKELPDEREIAFIGGPGAMGDRPGFLSWLSQRHRVTLFGRKDSWLPYLSRFPELEWASELRPKGYARVCASSSIILGLNQSHDSALYFSNRIFLTLACQGFHLTHYVPRMEEVFERGVHLDWFDSREECDEKIGWYLEHPRERRKIAMQGAALVHAEHRYQDRVQEILRLLAQEAPLHCPVDEIQAHENPFAEAILETVTRLSPIRRLSKASGGFED